MPRRKTKEQFVSQCRELWGDRFNYDKVEYLNQRTEVTIYCNVHKRYFTQQPFCHLTMKHYGCPDCTLEATRAKRSIPQEEIIDRCKTKFGDKFKYNKVKYVNQNTNITIICPNHGEVNVNPQSFLKSDFGCTKCAREHAIESNKITKEEFIQRAEEKFGERFDYSNLEYKGYEEKTTFVCRLHTKFVTSPFLHLLALDGGCPECRQYRAEHMNSAMTTEEYIEQAKIVHGETYDYTPTDYRSYKKMIRIRCKKHDYVFQLLPKTHLHGVGCPICEQEYLMEYEQRKQEILEKRKVKWERIKQKREISSKLLADKPAGIPYGVEEFLRLARLIHEDDFDYPNIKQEYKNLNTPITIHCNEHDSNFLQKPIKHLRGQGCPRCIGRHQTTESFIQDATYLHQERYTYEKVKFNGAEKKVIITCKTHGDFKMLPGEHLRGKGCPHCATSILEKKVISFLKKETDYIIEPQKQFPWLKTSRTMPLDVYLPELNLAIECQGMQHFYANEMFGGKKAFIIQKHKDELKHRLCKEHSITILYFAATTYKVPETYLGPVFIRLEELLNEIKSIAMSHND